MSLSKWLTSTGPTPATKRKLDDNVESSPSKKTFSKELSQDSFSWYIQDSNGKWHCSVCREAKMDNAYAKGHDEKAKTTNHRRHASSGVHKTAVTKTTLAPLQPMKKVVQKQLNEANEATLGYLWAAYNLAKRELPKDEFPYMIDLIEMSGKDMKRNTSTMYTSPQIISEFQAAIADVILEEKLMEIKNSGVYSVVVDESTDNGNRKRLLVYAQYLKGEEISMCLLNNIEICEGSATADIIVSHVLDELAAKGLDLKNLVGIGSDGASVMTGRKNGVVKQLRDKCPSLVGVHCAAHRCALAVSQAARGINDIQGFERTLGNIFRFFSNSALRENKLREIQEMLSLPQLKYADIHSVRWLSMEQSVAIMYRTYPALCTTLSHIAATGDIVAKSLLNEVTQFKFVGIMHLMMDILPFIGRLSKLFQSECLDFSKVMPVLNSTCESLNDLCEVNGVFLEKLDSFIDTTDEGVIYTRPSVESTSKQVKDNIQSNYEFEGFSDSEEEEDNTHTCEVDIKYYAQQKHLPQQLLTKYIDSIVNNLNDRFQQKELIQNMEVIVPTNIGKQPSLSKYGDEEIKNLSTNFSAQQQIDIDLCRSEYRQYKRLVSGSYKDRSLLEMTSVLDEKYQEELPNMCKLLKCCAVIPMNTAQCERGFSTQNRIKNKLRTKMNNRTLVDLMRISEDGPPMKEFPFEAALFKWKNEKTRKIFRK